MIAYETFCRQLVGRDPDAQQVYRDHVEDNGEELPYVFLGSYWIPLLFRRYSGNRTYKLPEDQSQTLLSGFQSEDARLSDLVALSVLDNIALQQQLRLRIINDLPTPLADYVVSRSTK